MDRRVETALNERNLAVASLRQAARSVGHNPGRGLLGVSGDARPSSGQIAALVNSKRGIRTAVRPEDVDAFAGQNGLRDVTEIVAAYRQRFGPDAVAGIIADREYLQAEYGPDTVGAGLSASPGFHAETVALAEVLNS